MTGGNQLNAAERYVCILAHPERCEPENRPAELPQRFIDHNKLGAVVAEAIPKYEEKSNSVSKKATIAEIGTVTQLLESNEIEYAIIKSILPLPKQIGDIDILVDDFARAESLLRSQGYEEEGRDPYKIKYHRITDNGRVAVHLHDEIAWHGEVYLDKRDVLANTNNHQYEGATISVPAPDHDALIIAAHMLFEKGNNKIILLDVLSFWKWYHDGALDLELMQSLAQQRGWRYGLRCYLVGTANVYRRTYDEPFSPDGRIEGLTDFPVSYNPLYATFPIRFAQMYRIRNRRLHWLMQNASFRETAHCLQAYLRDFAVEFRNRYGFTYTRKRLLQ